MTLGDGKLADTGQAVHLAGILIPKQRGSLAVTQGQFPVAVLGGLVYVVLEGTGHGTQGENLIVLFFISQDKHAFFIMIPVIGDHIEVFLGHQRRLGTDITAFFLLVFNPALQRLDDSHALWHDQRQTLSDHIHGGEQLHLAAQFIVIPFLGLLQPLHMLL